METEVKTVEFYVASFGHRYSDPVTTFVALRPETVEDAVGRAMEWERNELPGYCDHDSDNGDGRCADDCESCAGSTCKLCYPDLVWYGAWKEKARDIFLNARELASMRRDLMDGQAVALER